ncbi:MULTISPECIES: threonine--tRNA ligase [unclassified Brevundimonas]|jgi:threonyl-tRNA synthetase|uniref:threonine--tRNA ligase n=1 Tax=unclassified Brevundimonas TaxID=2622653 RepID=UPI000C4FAA76|nr:MULTISPECIES: threonine--tRNA ligase [unclassified Brevundimonas]MAL89232.1 threonine--tRNA ligase [Brevundimonas sp.]|tara:strand:- start:4838 stop:6763 length:1926 start_codon:yes stop_codon:yes gene_type:complete
MIDLKFPDGAVRQFPSSTTGRQVAASISPSLAKKAALAEINGEQRDLDRPIETGGDFRLLMRDDPAALETIRHDAAHVLAQAVQELFPGTQVTIGPAIDDGFYYDFHREEPFSTDDFAAIEKRMGEIVDRDEKLVREVWDRDEAIIYFDSIGERFKAELIRDLPENEVITVYRTGKWLDLCRGPHFPSTKFVGKAFKLTKLAGAYWRGDHRNPQLQRIYATAWASKEDLDAHLKRLEEAEKRDHRKLGRAMELFHMQEEGRGMVFWHPKGWVLWQVIEAYMRRRLNAAGYVEVKTPQVLDRKFWEASGHWDKYRPNMFVCETVEGEELSLKPMNCPGHVQIFDQGLRSYRELPLRMAEFGACHRYEPSGALHGLMRVRGFVQDDAHIFCREDQIVEETSRFIDLARSVHADLGMETAYISLGTRPEVRAGTDEFWDKAEAQMAEAARAAGTEPVVTEGDGAFYAPKLDFVVKDAIGREWTCGTIQLDYVLPERLGAEYVGEDGAKHRPVMLHRAILGSFERFIGIMIENYAGAFPLWLAPVQIVVATIVSDADDYAKQVAEKFKAAGLRVETDLRNEKVGYKVREHSVAKVPVIAVVGKNEAEEGKVAIRRLGSQGQEIVSIEEAIRILTDEATPPDLKRG